MIVALWREHGGHGFDAPDARAVQDEPPFGEIGEVVERQIAPVFGLIGPNIVEGLDLYILSRASGGLLGDPFQQLNPADL